MKEIIKVLENLVAERGLPAVSADLGHYDTQRLRRWLKEKNIPQREVGVVKKILEHMGELS